MRGDRVLPEPEQHLRRGLATDAAVHESVVCEKLRRRSYPRVRDRIAQKNGPDFFVFQRVIGVAVPAQVRPGENKRQSFSNLFARCHPAASALARLCNADFSEKENIPFLRPHK